MDTKLPISYEIDSEATNFVIIDFNQIVNDVDGDELIISTIPPSVGDDINSVLGNTATLLNNNRFRYNISKIVFQNDSREFIWTKNDGLIRIN